MAQKFYLIISTANPENNFLGLTDLNLRYFKRKKFRAPTSEEFFKIWKKFLNIKDFCNIFAIIVHQGSGSFSGLRLGATVANGIKIAYPKIKLYKIKTKNLNEFTKKINNKKFQPVPCFIKPEYPQSKSII